VRTTLPSHSEPVPRPDLVRAAARLSSYRRKLAKKGVPNRHAHPSPRRCMNAARLRRTLRRHDDRLAIEKRPRSLEPRKARRWASVVGVSPAKRDRGAIGVCSTQASRLIAQGWPKLHDDSREICVGGQEKTLNSCWRLRSRRGSAAGRRAASRRQRVGEKSRGLDPPRTAASTKSRACGGQRGSASISNHKSRRRGAGDARQARWWFSNGDLDADDPVA